MGEFTFKALCVIVIAALSYVMIMGIIKIFQSLAPNFSTWVGTLISSQTTEPTISIDDVRISPSFDPQKGSSLIIDVDYNAVGFSNTEFDECVLFYDKNGAPLIDIDNNGNVSGKKGGQIGLVGSFDIKTANQSGTLNCSFLIKDLLTYKGGANTPSPATFMISVLFTKSDTEQVTEESILCDSGLYQFTLSN